MKKNRFYIPHDGVAPLKGMDSTSPSTLLEPSLSPSMLNMDLWEGTARKRPGYLAFGTQLVLDDASASEFLEIIDFELDDGTRKMVAVGEEKIFYLDGETWTEITTALAWVAEEGLVNWVIASGTIGGTFKKVLIISNGLRDSDGLIV